MSKVSPGLAPVHLPDPANSPSDRLSDLLAWLVHPLVIVLASLAIAAIGFPNAWHLSDVGVQAGSLVPFSGGAVLLVLIAVFFQQQIRARQARVELDRHFAQASDEFGRMINALEERSSKKSEPRP